MSLLFSNFAPLRTRHKTYPDTFKALLRESDQVRIATGYISADSAIDLKSIVDANGGPNIELCVGMHYFDGLTPIQMQALQNLDDTLRNGNYGQVHMVTTFPYHGKVVSFSKQNRTIGSILGSSNLSNIIEGSRQYEADVLFQDSDYTNELDQFISDVISKTSKPFSTLGMQATIPENDMLKDQLGVTKITASELNADKSKLSSTTFEIPLKGDDAQRSGLNATFGEGRRNPQGFVIPRSWYEVELIVSNKITVLDGYPKADSTGDGGSFSAITDDGWQFRCKVSGDYSKNFRSEDDLKILGKWLKGRLENAGVLRAGERVTDETLARYGRNNMTITKLNDSNTWYLDFGVSTNV
jgi:hypothetical protein